MMMNQTIKGYFVDQITRESIPVLKVKSIEYTLKPENEREAMPNPLRDILLSSKNRLKLEFEKALPELIEIRNSIRLESAHEDNFLYASRPFGRFIGDCISCSFYEDTNVGFSEIELKSGEMEKVLKS